jgi:type IV secretory pathway TraG/TraD family ATPase VirD4
MTLRPVNNSAAGVAQRPRTGRHFSRMSLRALAFVHLHRPVKAAYLKDFFESALAFMAGYGIKSFLIAQSLNQIEKAYGPNNAILDNCHVRVSFATNDERTAKRVSDALGTATEMRAMKNYAGHRLNPWLGHLMVSRQETARPLLTPGEVMQLPPRKEIVMVAGTPPIRAKKVRYYEDRRFTERVLPPAGSRGRRTVIANGRVVGARNAEASGRFNQ